MRPRFVLSAFLAVFSITLLANVAAAQAGADAGVIGGMIVGNVERSAMRLTQDIAEMRSAKDQGAREIELAREKFWIAYPNGPDLPEARKEFARQLWGKDYYYAYQYIMFGNAPGDHRAPTGLQVIGQLFTKAVGGELDGGIRPSAIPEFDVWIRALRSELGGENTSVMVTFTHEQLLAALIKTAPYYNKYVVARNRAECATMGVDEHGVFHRDLFVKSILAESYANLEVKPPGSPQDYYQPMLAVLGPKLVYAAADKARRAKPDKDDKLKIPVDGGALTCYFTYPNVFFNYLKVELKQGDAHQRLLAIYTDYGSLFGWKGWNEDAEKLILKYGENAVRKATARVLAVEFSPKNLEANYANYGSLGCRGNAYDCLTEILDKKTHSGPHAVTAPPDYKRIAGCWRFNGFEVRMLPSGEVAGGMEDPGSWVFEGDNSYQVAWRYSFDLVTLSRDGNSLADPVSNTPPVSAQRTSGQPGGLSGTWKWSNGWAVTVSANGNVAAGPFSGSWNHVGGDTYKITWSHFPVYHLVLSADGRSLSGQDQSGGKLKAVRVTCSNQSVASNPSPVSTPQSISPPPPAQSSARPLAISQRTRANVETRPRYQRVQTIAPQQNTTGILIARGPVAQATGAPQVNVPNPVPVAPPQPQPQPVLPPSAHLTAVPLSITQGQSTRLSWFTENATSVSVQPGVGSVQSQGSVEVAPRTPTTYILTARGAGRSTIARVTVNVLPAGPSQGTIVWEGQVHGSTTVSIEGNQPSIGTIAGGGLPGLPCTVQLENSNQATLQSSPAAWNGWKLILLQVRGNGRVTVRIDWSLLHKS
jgi:hypothetical protein